MSGWQRIGVVISVLWMLAVPSYFVVVTHQDGGDYYRDCIGRVTSTTTQGVKEELEHCAEVERQIVYSPARMVRNLLFQEGDTFQAQLLWGIILVPVAILWIVGGIVSATLRWIVRGFARK